MFRTFSSSLYSTWESADVCWTGSLEGLDDVVDDIMTVSRFQIDQQKLEAVPSNRELQQMTALDRWFEYQMQHVGLRVCFLVPVKRPRAPSRVHHTQRFKFGVPY
jgi:hypothetical protein